MHFVYTLQSCTKAFYARIILLKGMSRITFLCIGSNSPYNPSATPLCVGGEPECVVHHKMSIYVGIVHLRYIIHQGDVKR